MCEVRPLSIVARNECYGFNHAKGMAALVKHNLVLCSLQLSQWVFVVATFLLTSKTAFGRGLFAFVRQYVWSWQLDLSSLSVYFYRFSWIPLKKAEKEQVSLIFIDPTSIPLLIEPCKFIFVRILVKYGTVLYGEWPRALKIDFACKIEIGKTIAYCRGLSGLFVFALISITMHKKPHRLMLLKEKVLYVKW